MPIVPLQNFGKYGVVNDTLNSALPIGTWTDARNMRFTGIQMEKMLEPTMMYPWSDDYPPVWMQGWADSASTYLVVATQTELFFLLRNSDADAGTWLNVTRDSGPYDASGTWDSFAWGDTCIFNNGADVPQIFDQNELKFIDLPNWGLVSTADDIANFAAPSRQTGAICKILKPYKNQLVAMGISEQGLFQPNTVWWSDITSLSTIDTTGPEGSGPPSWDYESPETASAKSEVGIGYGAITCAANLNENMVIYTDNSATLMQFVGGGFIMSFRRLFNKGAAGQKCAVEFNNQHFVLSRDQIYLHDGSTVKLIAKDRVEEEFFRRLGKQGRFGGSEEIDWERIQVVQNPDRKEISIIYDRVGEAYTPDIYCGELVLSAARECVFSTGVQYAEAGGDGFHFIQTSSSGSKMMLNYQLRNTSPGAFKFSSDGGDTFTDTALLSSPDSGTEITWLEYDNDNDRWWVGGYSPVTVRFTVWYSENDGTSWTKYLNASALYARTSILAREDLYHFAGSATSGVGEVRRYTNPPVDTTLLTLDPWGTPVGTLIGGRVHIQIAPGRLFIVHQDAQGQTAPPYHALMINTDLTDVQTFEGMAPHLYNYAYNKNGNIISRSQDDYVAGENKSIVEFVSINSTLQTNEAFPTFTIDFGTAVDWVHYAWSDVLGGYLVSAEDTIDQNLLHLRYNRGTNFDDWYEIPSIRLCDIQWGADYRQLHWSHGDVFYYAYIRQTNSVYGSYTLDRIILNAVATEEFTGTHLLNSFDATDGSGFPSDDGTPNLITTLPMNTTHKKYGAGSMGYTGTTNGYATLASAITLNNNNFTVRMYYKPVTLSAGGNVAGLFQYGAFGQDTNIVAGYEFAGKIGLIMKTQARTSYIETDTAVLTAGQADFSEIEFEICRSTNKMYIYHNGTKIKEGTITQVKWAGTTAFYVGYRHQTGFGGQYSLGYIDEIQVVNDSIHRGVSHAASTEPYV